MIVGVVVFTRSCSVYSPPWRWRWLRSVSMASWLIRYIEMALAGNLNVNLIRDTLTYRRLENRGKDIGVASDNGSYVKNLPNPVPLAL